MMQNDRPVIRCKHCQLRQYITRDGNCRRCRRPFLARAAPVIPVAVVAERSAKHEKQGWGQVLMMFRELRGLSQKQLAMKSSRGRTFISRLEQRIKPPTVATTVTMAKALGLPFYALIQVQVARNYYCDELMKDPVAKEVSDNFMHLSTSQRHIILDTVQSLVEGGQLPFTDWQMVFPQPMEVRTTRCPTA